MIQMKIRILIFTIGLLITVSLHAQRLITPTNSFSISGKIKYEKVITLNELDSFQTKHINDQLIYNHKGELKDTLKALRGIPIKAIFNQLEYIYDKPKTLNEFYFVFIASDGYKVVFSWNEIYNTSAGDNFFIISEMGGKKLQDLDQRIIFLSTADLKSGRRYIKGLERIEVRQVE